MTTVADKKLQILNIFVDGVCLDLDVGYDRFQRSLDAKDLGLKDEDVPEIFKLGKKLLLPKKVTGVFDSIAGQARRIVEFYSFTFPIRGLRFIPNRVLPKLLEELETSKGVFDKAVTKFCDEYDENRLAMLDTYKEHRSALEKLYPTKEDARDSFSFTYKLFALTMPPSLQEKAVDLLTSEEAVRKTASIIEKKQRELVNEFDTWAQDMVQDARKAVLALFGEIKNKVDKKELVHSKTLESLRSFVDHFRMMNVVGDKAVEDALVGIRGLLDPLAANTDMGRGAFQEAAKAVVEAATKTSDVAAVTGTYRRRLLDETE